MRHAGIDALQLEAGSALVYFTGIRWWCSERFTAAIIPAEGDMAIVTPYFEEPSVRESMSFGNDVRTWHEHENPFVSKGDGISSSIHDLVFLLWNIVAMTVAFLTEVVGIRLRERQRHVQCRVVFGRCVCSI